MSKSYCIMRVEKRGRADVVGIQREANRTEADKDKGWFQSSDIDFLKTKYNKHFKKTDSWNLAITKRLKDENIKPRKDAVVLLDGLYAVSGAWLAEHSPDEADQYFRDCLQFHVNEYCGGDESLLLNAVLHVDEGEWHMQVASIPLINDREKGKVRLSAKDIMGNRIQYSKRQDSFWEAVGRGRGLERGDKTKEQDATEYRRHMTKREYELMRIEEHIRTLQAYVKDQEREVDEIEKAREEAEKKAKKLLLLLENAKNASDVKGFRLAVNELCKELKYHIRQPDYYELRSGGRGGRR